MDLNGLEGEKFIDRVKKEDTLMFMVYSSLAQNLQQDLSNFFFTYFFEFIIEGESLNISVYIMM